jgi:hypothetical protein
MIHELPAVETDLGGLLDDRVRELLALVPLFGGGTNDLDTELVDPLLELELVFVEVEGEIGHEDLLGRSNENGYPSVTDESTEDGGFWQPQ